VKLATLGVVLSIALIASGVDSAVGDSGIPESQFYTRFGSRDRKRHNTIKKCASCSTLSIVYPIGISSMRSLQFARRQRAGSRSPHNSLPVHLQKNVELLENVQKKALRMCSRQWPWDLTYHALLEQFHLPNLANRRVH